MPELLSKCPICQSLLDEEDLFCPNCGTEAPARERAAPSPALSGRLTRTNFTCSGCGASMSYDASAQALRCPFCGSVDLVAQPDTTTLAPHRVIPFVLNREQAIQVLRSWLGRGFWRPGDLAQQASVVTMVPVYVPYWVFHAHTFTCWTADTDQTPAGARASWYPLAGEHRGDYAGLLVGASGALSNSETAAICPFELNTGVPPEQVDLENVTVEQFSVPRRYARPLARQGLEAYETAAVAQECVPGSARNVHVNLRIEALESEPVLLPVWILAYRYRDELYRFLVNGQSGRPTGTAPTSWRKIAVAVLIVLAVVLGILGIFALANRPHTGLGGRFGAGPGRPAACLHPLGPSAQEGPSAILTAIVDSRSRPGLVGSNEPRTDPTAAEGDFGRRPRPAAAAHAGHGRPAGGLRAAANRHRLGDETGRAAGPYPV